MGGFDRPPAEAFADTDAVHLRVSAEGFTRLTRFVHEHYVRDAAGAPVRLQPGVQPRSWFYLAQGCYHVLRNSNNWTLRALRAAGAPVVPWRALTGAATCWPCLSVWWPSAETIFNALASRPPWAIPTTYYTGCKAPHNGRPNVYRLPLHKIPNGSK